MRVLITGGAGFIGSHIVELLLEHGHDVAVIDNLSTGKEENVPKGARLYPVDLTSWRIQEVLAAERPEVIIHQAAQIDVRRSVENPAMDARVNIIGSINLLEHAREFGVQKVVYASSAAVYGNPLSVPVAEDHPILATSPYGVSKYVVERYLYVYRELYGIDFTVLRYANVYGPRQDPLGEGGVVAIFTHRLAKGLPVTIFGDGEQTRDYVYVGDVARANLLALTQGGGEVVNISCAREVSVNQLLQIMQDVTGVQATVHWAPKRPGEIDRSALANDRARRVLGWRPSVTLAEGIERVFAYERASL